jgi:hypothetical protein
MLCRFYQWKIERQIDDGHEQWNRRLKRHIDHCPSCNSYANQLTQLQLHLSGAAPCRLQPEAVRPLAARVMDAIVGAQPPAECVLRVPFSNPVPAKIFAGTLAAGLMVVIGVLVVRIEQTSLQPDSVLPINIDARTLQTPLPVVASWSEKPMQEELSQIGSDIERAVSFLLRSLPAVEPVEREDEP